MTDAAICLIYGLIAGAFIGVMIMSIKNTIKAPNEQERNAELNKAYMQGYELGKAAGEQEAIFKKYTPNDLRAFFDLPPIEGGEEWAIK